MLLIKKINSKLIKINDFVITQLFIINKNVVDNLITTIIIVEIHLIDDLKTNMFVNVNVLKSQKIILNFEHNIFIVNNCNVTITINLINRDKLYIKQIIRN